MSNPKVTVDVKGIKEFESLIKIIKDFTEDEQVPKHIREKYLKEVKDKVLGN